MGAPRARAVRDSRGRWCWREPLEWTGDVPCRDGGVLHALGVPDGAGQAEADDAASRMARRWDMEGRLGRTDG